MSTLWLLFRSNFAITFSILLPSLSFFFYTFLLSTLTLVKFVLIINKLLFVDMLLSNLSVFLADFCLYSCENILLEISGKRALCIGGFFMFIFTKLKHCPDWLNYFIANKLGFDFGVGIELFLLGFVILKLLVSFLSSLSQDISG